MAILTPNLHADDWTYVAPPPMPIAPDPAMVVKTLRVATEALERGWCQGAIARGGTAQDLHFDPLDPLVTAMCLEGALYYATYTLLGVPWSGADKTHTQQAEASGLWMASAKELARSLAQGRPCKGIGLASWNDDPRRTQQEVVTLVRETADALEAGL